MHVRDSLWHLPERHTTWIAYAAFLGIMAFLTFGSLTEHLFDADDLGYWEIMSITVEKDWTHFFSTGRTLAIRPPSDLFFLISYVLWGHDPVPPHALQVVFHVICSLLLAYTFRRTGISFELSLLAGLFFLMNVAHFRVVQWITCMNYTIGTMFFLFTIIAFTRFLASDRQTWLAGGSLLLALAIFTHPGMIAAAPFLLYLSWRKTRSLRRAAAAIWPILGVAVLCVGIAYAISVDSTQVRGLSTPPHPLGVVKYLFWYTGRLVSQAHWLTASLSGTPDTWELGLGLCACIGVIALFWRRRFPAADWAIWSLLSVLPFVYFPHVLLAGPSRHLYFASMGTSLVLAALIWATTTWIANRVGASRARFIFAVLLFGILWSSFSSLKRCEAMAFYSSGRNYIAHGDFKMGSEQFKRAIARDPYLTPPDAYARTALALIGMGQSPQSVLRKGLAIYPNAPVLNLYLGIWEMEQPNSTVRSHGETTIQRAFAQSNERDLLRRDAATCYYNLGTLCTDSGNSQKAEELYEKSLSYRPDDANTMILLGNALYEQGKMRDAYETFQKVVHAFPQNAGGHYALGFFLDTQGRTDEAIAEYAQALKNDPNNAQVHFHLAGALYNRGQIDEALHHCQKAIASDPDNPLPYRSLAVMLFETGERNAAIQALETAADLAPGHTDTWHSLAIAYRAQNRDLDAIAAYQQTIRLAPDNEEAHLGLAQVFEKLGRIEEAVEAYGQTLSLNPQNREARNALQSLSR